MPGVRTAEVNFLTESAKVVYDPTQASLEQMVAALAKLGYQARSTKGEKRTKRHVQ